METYHENMQVNFLNTCFYHTDFYILTTTIFLSYNSDSFNFFIVTRMFSFNTVLVSTILFQFIFIDNSKSSLFFCVVSFF